MTFTETAKQTPQSPQPDLPGIADNRPHELTVSGWQLEETLARIKCGSGHVQSMETVPHHDGQWLTSAGDGTVSEIIHLKRPRPKLSVRGLRRLR
jgi:hypothetical protein